MKRTMENKEDQFEHLVNQWDYIDALVSEESDTADGWHEVSREPPPNDKNLIVVFSGVSGGTTYIDSMEFATYYDSEGWVLQGHPDLINLKISWWRYAPDLPEQARQHLKDFIDKNIRGKMNLEPIHRR